jgi:VCBS repeat-containing protein
MSTYTAILPYTADLWSSSPWAVVWNPQTATASSTSLTLLGYDGTTTVLSGTGFLFDQAMNALGGTVTRVERYDGTTLLSTITDTTTSLDKFQAYGDVAVGTALSGDDVINGSSSSDLLFGYSGNDKFNPGDSTSALDGLWGDFMIGGAGNDIFNGGDNPLATVVYALEGGGAGVSVDLGTGIATDTFGDTDTLNNIRVVVGTLGNDDLAGGSSDETFYPGLGTDRINGGSGFDVLSFDSLNRFFFEREFLNLFPEIAWWDYGGVLGGIVVQFDGEGAGTVFGTGCGCAVDANKVYLEYGSAIFAGIEKVVGTGGYDTAVFSGLRADYTLTTDKDQLIVEGADGRHLLSGFERLQFADGIVTLPISGEPTNTFTIGDGGDFATITAALASGSVMPGATLALLSGYNTESATVGIENLTFSGDASNTGIALTLSTGIMAITLTGSAPIAVTGNESNNSIIGNDGSNMLAGGGGNDSINGGAGDDTMIGGGGDDTIIGGGGDDTIYYEVGTGGSPPTLPAGAYDEYPYWYLNWQPSDGIDTIDGGANYDTLRIFGTPVLYDDSMWWPYYGGNSVLNVVVVDGAITGINGGRVANVESVILDLGQGEDPLYGIIAEDTLDYAGTMEAVTVNLATGTATGFTSIASVEQVFGGLGNDTLIGDAGYNMLAGGAGLDTLIGGDGWDSLDGGDGADSLDGGAGDDWLAGGDGADTLDGGAGDDRLKGGIGFDTLTGRTGVDRFEGSLPELNGDRITDYETGERIVLDGSLSGPDDVRLVATGADTELQIDGNNDGSFETIITLTGTISGTILLSNELWPTDNVIRIVTPSSAATSGGDVLVGTPAADTIDGLAGDDEIFGLFGNDTLVGGTGSDALYGGDGDDDLKGGVDRDYLYGDSGADTLEGGDGYDVLFGGDGDDVLTDNGTDGYSAFMDGGAGNDVLLDSSAGGGVLYGGADNDTLIGGIGEDKLYGGDGNDRLYGGAGIDTLDGGAGDDRLQGGDVLDTGDWYVHDYLTGGPGADTFVFGSTAGPTATVFLGTITDWEPSDIIDLAGLDANTSIAGNQDFTFLGLGTPDLTVGQGQLKYYEYGGTTYLVGNATADNQADFQIAINGLHTLTADQIQGLAHVLNVAPVATVDTYSTNEDQALIIGAAGVLLNDTDADNDPLTAILVSGVQHGTLALNANGSFSYTSDVNYNGPDSFTYKANDGQADSNVATVSLAVTPVNDAPVASNDIYALNEDTTLTASVLANDTDVDGNALTVSRVSDPAHGTVTLANGSFTYTPATNYNGADSFTYKANDGQADSNVATVSLTVTPVNDVPVARNDSYATTEHKVLTVNAAAGVLANDSDVDGDTLYATMVSGPTQGKLTFNSDGSFVYKPLGHYDGPDSFRYKAFDGSASSDVTTVSITVNPVNQTLATRDFNADANSDILWQHDSGLPEIWAMAGTMPTDVAILPSPGSDWLLV